MMYGTKYSPFNRRTDWLTGDCGESLDDLDIFRVNVIDSSLWA